MGVDPTGQALPCPCSHLDKGTACYRRPGTASSLQALGTHREGQACAWLQALGCLGLRPAGKQSGANLLLVGQCRVHELAVEYAGALGIRGQQPYHKGDLELKVEGEPVEGTEARGMCQGRESAVLIPCTTLAGPHPSVH